MPGIILVTSTNFILKNIFVKVPFWAKMMVPYESQKREKIHISYIVHPRKISLTESRGTRSFFILKSGVHFSFWAIFNLAYRVPETLKSHLLQKGSLENFHILVLETPYTIEEVGTSLISWTFFLTQLYFKRGVWETSDSVESFCLWDFVYPR